MDETNETLDRADMTAMARRQLGTGEEQASHAHIHTMFLLTACAQVPSKDLPEEYRDGTYVVLRLSLLDAMSLD